MFIRESVLDVYLKLEPGPQWKPGFFLGAGAGTQAEAEVEVGAVQKFRLRIPDDNWKEPL